MKAAVVHRYEEPPQFADIAPPVAQQGEVLVSTRAAALSQLVRAQAAGKHYSTGALPMVPGADGVGVLADGRRVYFAFPRAPIGAMAETVAVKAEQCVDVPAEVDDITAAAIANPGMSSWAALTHRAQLQRGESVLVIGAAGASGRLAIQIAKHLGAGRVVAAARNPAVEAELSALGADEFVALDQPADTLRAAFRGQVHGHGVDVVLDYLWGAPAGSFLVAAGGHGSGKAEPRIRFVNIGAMAGARLPLAASVLRSSQLELTGSGLGSVSYVDLVSSVGALLRATVPARLAIDAVAMPLRDVERAWMSTTAQRIVLTP